METLEKQRSSFTDQFKKCCQKAGIKYTQQRMMVYQEVFNSPNHPDAEAIFNSVRKKLSNISLDTVYRTLWLLKDMDLIRTLGPSRERTRFDANLSRHHHFICTQCNTIVDFRSKRLDEIKIIHAVKSLGKPSGLQINIQGVCSNCEPLSHPGKEG